MDTKRGDLEIATFYEKEYDTDHFLYQLYDAALYTSTYARIRDKTALGRILLFNLETDNRNVADSYEHLLLGTSMYLPLALDSKNEVEQMNRLRNTDNLLWRSGVYVNDNDFADRFVGSVDLSSDDLLQYTQEQSEMWREIIKNRFLAQDILARSLALFGPKSQES